MGWHYVITQEMREDLALTGNDLLVYAVINGYSQKQGGVCFCTASEIGHRCGIRRETVVRIVKRLAEAGYISKGEIFRNGIRFCSYEVCDKKSQGVTENHRVCDEKSHIENKDENKDGFINKPSLSNGRAREGRFTPPTLEEVAAYCDERGNAVDPQQFIDFYESKGWKIGTAPMKDWRAAVRTWESREDRGPRKPRTTTAAASASPSLKITKDDDFLTAYYKNHDSAFGTHLYADFLKRQEQQDKTIIR